MDEVRFYHLEHARLEDALGRLLGEHLRRGERAIVEAPEQALVEALDERLWTFSDDSFLPHGLARDGEPQTQPVLLTTTRENPNNASLRVLVGGARILPLPSDDGALRNIVLMFDGRSEDDLAAARAQWTEVKAAGSPLSYWREGDGGEWVRAR